MAEERVGDVVQSRLARNGFGVEAEGGPPPRALGPVEVGGRRVSEQLEQRDAALGWGRTRGQNRGAFRCKTNSSRTSAARFALKHTKNPEGDGSSPAVGPEGTPSWLGADRPPSEPTFRRNKRQIVSAVIHH